MNLEKYKNLFLSESQQYLSILESNISKLEKNLGDESSIDELFRAFHSIKGMASAMGFQEISKLSHVLENLLDEVRSEKITVNEAVISILWEGRDLLDALVSNIEKDVTSDEELSNRCAEVIAKCKSSDSQKEEFSKDKKSQPKVAVKDETEKESLSSNKTGQEIRVTIRLSNECAIPAARGFLIHKRLSSIYTIINCDPQLEKIRKGDFDREITFTIETDVNEDEILKSFKGLTDVSEIIFPDSKQRTNPIETTKPVEVEKIKDSQGKPKAPAVTGSHGNIKVSAKFLDDLIDQTGEVLISALHLNNFALKNFDSMELSDSSNKIIQSLKEVYEKVLMVRMTPLELITEKIPRLVRELSRKTKKSINFEIEGQEILIDRAILGELDSPLIHMIRNCVDHGIEPPEVRIKSGKPEKGSISIHAYHDRGMVLIKVSDDGGGIDPNKLKEKAIQKGLLTREQANHMSESEANKIICMPGFSTAETVSEVSGRGVGMDAVQNMVDTFDGELVIGSKLGKGTEFQIKLPLTVSSAKVLMFKISDQTYAFPISKIKKTLEVSKDSIKSQQGKKALVFENNLIPLIPLREFFKLSNENDNKQVDPVPVVVVDYHGKSIAISVDLFEGQQEVVMKPLSDTLKEIPLISGATVLANGQAMFILDLNKLIQMGRMA